jgi:probable rRNA maturation factor
MDIDVQSRVASAPPAARVRSLLSRAARLVPRGSNGRAGRDLSVLFCGDRRMRGFNRRYRGKDRPTDVLSFPAAAPLLGDIAICVPYAARQARRLGEPVSREIDRLLVHGYLHLLGYDHEVDSGEMDELESRMRRRLGIA